MLLQLSVFWMGRAIEKVRIGHFGGVLAYLISKTVSRTLIAS